METASSLPNSKKKKKNNDCRNIYGSSNIPREVVQSLEAADHVMLS
jgi:hypothetical protein